MARVHALAHERMPGFGEVDANLMCATGLESTAHQSGGAAQARDHFDVRYGPNSEPALLCAAAESVAAILDEVRVERRAVLAKVTDDESDVLAADLVFAKQPREMALCKPSACEHHEPGGLFVDAMNHEQRRVRGRHACAMQRNTH